MTSTDPVRRGRHAVWDLHVHLVFVTKYRREVFNRVHLDRLEELFTAVCSDFGATLEECNGEGDHVHLLVGFPASVQLSKLVNSLKGVSSRMLRKEHGDHINRYLWNGHLWSRSYYAGTTGGAGIETVRRYIEGQGS